MPALFILAVGVLSLVVAIGVIDSPQLKLALPILLIVAGLLMLVRKRCGRCHTP